MKTHSSENKIEFAHAAHSNDSKVRDIAFKMPLCDAGDIDLSKIATLAKIAVPLIPSRKS